MQTSYGIEVSPLYGRNSDRTKGSGLFVFTCGAVLVGVLIGTLCYAASGEGFAQPMLSVGEDILRSRPSMDHAGILLRSFVSTSAYLAVLFVLGFCGLGQPFEIAAAVFRGMGAGLTVSQLYSVSGTSSLPYAMGLILPGAVISLLAVASGAKEAFSLSCIFLRHSLSDRSEQGLAGTVKLYGAKFLVLEALAALAAGADVLCNYLFIYHFAVR